MRVSIAVVALLVATAEAAPCVDGDAYAERGLRDDVGFLASKALDGRAPGSPGDRAAQEWIAARFACLGLVPAFADGYAQPFTADGHATANLVGYVAGTDPTEIILIAAHFDHLSGGHLGANDNASGVAAMLAIARDVMQREAPRRTIVFAAFGSEETGMHGSSWFSTHAPEALGTDRIVQVINLDMVGSHSSRGIVAAMGTFKGLAATSILRDLAKPYRSIHVALGGKARGSDFEPFCKQGTPYVFFWTPDKRCYHGRCDTPDRVDYKHMVDIAKLAGELTIAMAATAVDLAAAKQTRGCFGARVSSR